MKKSLVLLLCSFILSLTCAQFVRPFVGNPSTSDIGQLVELADSAYITVDTADTTVFISASGRIHAYNITSNRVKSIIGNGIQSSSSPLTPDNSVAATSLVRNPMRMAYDTANKVLYFMEYTGSNFRIQSIQANGLTKVIASSTAQFNLNSQIAIDAANRLLYYSGTQASTGAVKILVTSIANPTTHTIFAGGSSTTFNGDNIDALSTNIGSIDSIYVDSAKNLVYYNDPSQQRIRYIDRATNKTFTLAGGGTGSDQLTNVNATGINFCSWYCSSCCKFRT